MITLPPKSRPVQAFMAQLTRTVWGISVALLLIGCGGGAKQEAEIPPQASLQLDRDSTPGISPTMTVTGWVYYAKPHGCGTPTSVGVSFQNHTNGALVIAHQDAPACSPNTGTYPGIHFTAEVAVVPGKNELEVVAVVDGVTLKEPLTHTRMWDPAALLHAIRVSPTESDMWLDVGTVVRVAFDRPVKPSTLDSDSFYLMRLDDGTNITGLFPGHVVLSADGRVATLTPDAPFPHPSRFEAHMKASRITDESGLPLYSTAMINPDNLATNPDYVWSVTPWYDPVGWLSPIWSLSQFMTVPVDAPLTVSFTSALDPGLLNANWFQVMDANSIPVAGTLSVAGHDLTFTPTAPWSPGVGYHIALGPVVDIHGTTLRTDTSLYTTQWSFSAAP